MSKKKEPISDNLLNQFVQIMLNVDDITRTEGIFFSIESLKKNGTVQKYIDAHLGDELRKCILLQTCEKLRPKNESSLQEKDLITIFRATLRQKNIKLVGMNDPTNVSKTRIYYISNVVEII